MASKPEGSDQITIPEDLSTLSDEELGTLHDQAVSAFQAAYSEGDAPDDETLAALGALTEGIDALRAEGDRRNTEALARSTQARELAEKVLSSNSTEEAAAETDEDEAMAGKKKADPDEAEEDEETIDTEPTPAELASKSKPRRALNINLAGLKSDRPAPQEEAPVNSGPKPVGFAAQGAAGYDVGSEMSIGDMAKAINSRLGGFNVSAYEMAAERGQRQSERFTIAKMHREFPSEAIVTTEDPTDAMKYAVNEAALPGGSLVASGGWCAPSETLYDLLDISEAADLISLPEMLVNRGGIRFSLGPNYGSVFSSTGFAYTEAQDIAGNYNGAGGGTKPCFTVPCPSFTDVRLGYAGVCIGAGLLQQRGYPEVIEDYIGKTLTAHAHRVSAAVINSMVSQSTAVSLTAGQAGSAAPILTAVDLQAQHLRATHRMGSNRTLEVVLPTWVKSSIRADLARRQGVDLLDVSDARIAGWFAARNVNVQYVVDWQDISTTAASGYIAPPSSVQFLLYAAGTFVKGVSESITLENVYDSVLLGTNNYTALFTEDPYLVAKRLHDSRVVTVPLAANGSTHNGQPINNAGVGS